MNYEKDIQIDESALDVEWLSQASLMLKYTRHQASTAKDEELAKEELDLVKAELDKEIRSEPEKFKIEKITEGAITSAILTSKRYKEISQRCIDAKFENNVAKGAVRSFEQRKDALENLVRLHGQQYFAGPKVPRDLAWEVEERQKRIDAKVKIVRRTK